MYFCVFLYIFLIFLRICLYFFVFVAFLRISACFLVFLRISCFFAFRRASSYFSLIPRIPSCFLLLLFRYKFVWNSCSRFGSGAAGWSVYMWAVWLAPVSLNFLWILSYSSVFLCIFPVFHCISLCPSVLLHFPVFFVFCCISSFLRISYYFPEFRRIS